MRRRAAAVGFALLAALAALATPTAAAATTTTTTPPNPATEILAVVSPIASPACGASGVATLLVPIVGGLLQTDLGLPKSVSIGAVLLNALGPVYIVCGDLPSSGAGTHCALDDQIAGVWPSSLPPDGVVAPTLVGNLVDSINNGLKVLDLPPSAALQSALECQVKPSTKAPRAPGAPPAPTSGATTPPEAPQSATGLPLTSALPLPTGSGVALTTPQVPVAPGSPTGPPVHAAGAVQLVSYLEHHVPSWLVALQIIVGIILGLFLAGSWLTSAKVARNGGTPPT